MKLIWRRNVLERNVCDCTSEEMKLKKNKMLKWEKNTCFSFSRWYTGNKCIWLCVCVSNLDFHFIRHAIETCSQSFVYLFIVVHVTKRIATCDASRMALITHFSILGTTDVRFLFHLFSSSLVQWPLDWEMKIDKHRLTFNSKDEIENVIECDWMPFVCFEFISFSFVYRRHQVSLISVSIGENIEKYWRCAVFGQYFHCIILLCVWRRSNKTNFHSLLHSLHFDSNVFGSPDKIYSPFHDNQLDYSFSNHF